MQGRMANVRRPILQTRLIPIRTSRLHSKVRIHILYQNRSSRLTMIRESSFFLLDFNFRSGKQQPIYVTTGYEHTSDYGNEMVTDDWWVMTHRYHRYRAWKIIRLPSTQILTTFEKAWKGFQHYFICIKCWKMIMFFSECREWLTWLSVHRPVHLNHIKLYINIVSVFVSPVYIALCE